MFTIKGKAILLSLATALLIHTVKTTFHELMETTHGLAIAFGSKGQVGPVRRCIMVGTEWVLSMESMLLALKVPRLCAQTPHWNLSGSLAIIILHLWPTAGL